MKKCIKCLLPETHESIIFNEDGLCNICVQNIYKNNEIEWSSRKNELDELIESHRGKYEYDCIIPFSGGKDSTWTLYYLIKEYNIKPLVVRFDHGFLRPNLNENTIKTLRNLGADFLTFTPNWKIVQKLMLQSFLEKGDFCWHCHTGIFSYPMHIAIKYKTPLIIWGEPSSEYTAYFSYDQNEEVDEKRFNRITNLGISASDMEIRFDGKIDQRDLIPFSYPNLKELRKINYRSVCLGSYIPWDVKKQSEIISKEIGWKGDEVENVPPEYSYEKIECYLQGVRDYIKYIKRGYTRPTHLASIDIRHGRLDREEGEQLIKKFEGKEPPSLELFIDHIGITKAEFYEIAISHTISPWEFNSNNIQKGCETHDNCNWCREGGMDKSDSKIQIDRWKKSNNQL